MQKPPISFRLSDQELEILEKAQRPGESISQTAARLLREKMGVLSNDQILEKTTLEEWIEKLIEAKVIAIEYNYQDMVKNEVLRINKKFEEISESLKGKSDRRPVKPKTLKSDSL